MAPSSQLPDSGSSLPKWLLLTAYRLLLTLIWHLPSPLTNRPSPIVPTGDRLSQDPTKRALFASFSMYEMDSFTCLRRSAYGV
jgi:hypothetical protein